jgi:hypothetical protein
MRPAGPNRTLCTRRHPAAQEPRIADTVSPAAAGGAEVLANVARLSPQLSVDPPDKLRLPRAAGNGERSPFRAGRSQPTQAAALPYQSGQLAELGRHGAYHCDAVQRPDCMTLARRPAGLATNHVERPRQALPVLIAWIGRPGGTVELPTRRLHQTSTISHSCSREATTSSSEILTPTAPSVNGSRSPFACSRSVWRFLANRSDHHPPRNRSATERKKSERVITPTTLPLSATGTRSTRWWRKISATWASEKSASTSMCSVFM